MKNVLKFTNLLMLLSLVILTFSCNTDDEDSVIPNVPENPEENEVVISLENLEVTINENPNIEQVIGTVQSNSEASLTYSITSQTPEGAIYYRRVICSR